ncbi:MAG: D-alanyl-D-alanine carboxypeptidase [Gammaproteobacteria bacterium]|jgi:D-alanyl-D-alanine carboxypeptidase (penicillin-binding protein 5/6)|nr:D-alanyl-D-alanine carboxypeptidase [Gammaproteobacteria bacterium]MBT5221358.1 D-alanyl-D-alanine carboxypeptidase [Gammaproteobacteria bacterium]MBT5826521.1 D-alanyl-D-alanine carboxypeptidase [Gammaproteobacteria bacterium]MBT5967294.1 D-alanyl-D-alanine carboxypeptidase [Gammaproteobacteria bacterium]MBT6421212.1 D-alanyl-D-alanine carboxypeptidase [Gammaproteobacteria bacterium]
MFLKIQKNIQLVFFISLLLPAAHSYAEGEIKIPAPPRLAASSYFLQDFDSGRILAERNADVVLPPASLTKIMTVYIAFRELSNNRLSLDDMVTISEKAWRTPGSKMFIEVNKQVKVEDLLKGIIIQSGNDASVAIAEHIAGDEYTFAELMNQQAQRLGMHSTHFMNATGLPVPDQHYTTARDLAILTRAVIKEFPEYYRWDSVKEFSYNNITQQNRNILLWRDESVDGVKTGHTEEAGYCLIASAKREQMRLISVVLGTKSKSARANESQTLLNYGFRFYDTHKLYEANTELTTARVWKGASDTVSLGVGEDLYVTISRRHYTEMKAATSVDVKIMAPVKQGDQLGVVNVTLRDETVRSMPLVALNTVEKGSFLQRTYDAALMLIK